MIIAMKTTLPQKITWFVFGCTVAFIAAARAAESPSPLLPEKDSAKKLAQMTARGPDASLTVLPVLLMGQPFDRVTEFVALLLEQQGLKTIELGPIPFLPGDGTRPEKLAEALASFVRQHPPGTEYVLFAAYNGDRQSGLNELQAVVADQNGAILWAESQTPADEAYRKANARDPMTMTMLLIDGLGPQLGLNADTAKAAKPGKYARLMDKRSGLPPQAERDALPARETTLLATRKDATILVIPTAVPDHQESAAAGRITQLIGAARLFKTASTPASAVALPMPRPDPNEMKMLWDLARELKEQVKNNPPTADYVLAVDYRFNPDRWEQGFVHFVICDRRGDWVMVDLQNSEHEDYQSIKPASKEACEKLLLKRLNSRLGVLR